MHIQRRYCFKNLNILQGTPMKHLDAHAPLCCTFAPSGWVSEWLVVGAGGGAGADAGAGGAGVLETRAIGATR